VTSSLQVVVSIVVIRFPAKPAARVKELIDEPRPNQRELTEVPNEVRAGKGLVSPGARLRVKAVIKFLAT